MTPLDFAKLVIEAHAANEEARSMARAEELLRLATPIARRRAVEGIPRGSIFIVEAGDDDGVRVALKGIPDALAGLPLEAVEDGERAAHKLLMGAPAGCVMLAVIHDAGVCVGTIPIVDSR